MDCLGEAKEFMNYPGKGIICVVSGIDVSNTSPQPPPLDVEVNGFQIDKMEIQQSSFNKGIFFFQSEYMAIVFSFLITCV